MKFSIGTAQFGIPYGISNPKETVSFESAKSILSYASSHKIHMVDTAFSYGKSEAVLGTIGLNDFEVTTKIQSIPKNCGDILGWMETQINISLSRLKKDCLYGLLVHDLSNLTQDEDRFRVYEALVKFKERKFIKKVGVSIYDPEELKYFMDIGDWDLIQAPFSVIDQRLASSGWLDALFKRNIEVHVRSIFLQGLLLLPSHERPLQFRKWKSLWDRWDLWVDLNNTNPLAACLGFVLSFKKISKIVIGVYNLEQLKQIIKASKTDFSKFSEFAPITDLDLINPSRWK